MRSQSKDLLESTNKIDLFEKPARLGKIGKTFADDNNFGIGSLIYAYVFQCVYKVNMALDCSHHLP